MELTFVCTVRLLSIAPTVFRGNRGHLDCPWRLTPPESFEYFLGDMRLKRRMLST